MTAKIITALAIGVSYAASIKDNSSELALSESSFPKSTLTQGPDSSNRANLTEPPSYSAVGSLESRLSNPSPEEAVLLLEYINEPEDFLKALAILDQTKALSSLSPLQQARVLKHALSIDPFRQYMVELAQPSSSISIADALRENGPLLLSEELDGGLYEFFITEDLRFVIVKHFNDMVIIPTIFREGEIVEFKSGQESQCPNVSGSIKANKHGLVISLSIPGEPPLRGEYWQGVELSYYTESIIPAVERVLDSKK